MLVVWVGECGDAAGDIKPSLAWHHPPPPAQGSDNIICSGGFVDPVLQASSICLWLLLSLPIVVSVHPTVEAVMARTLFALVFV